MFIDLFITYLLTIFSRSEFDVCQETFLSIESVPDVRIDHDPLVEHNNQIWRKDVSATFSNFANI